MRTQCLALCSVITIGCVTAKVEQLTPQRYAPISPDSVTVFAAASELQVDSIGYERVAMIFTKGSPSWTTQQGMFKKAREEAAKLGANGLLMAAMEGGGHNWLWGGENPRQGTIIAVRWRIIPLAERKTTKP